MLIAWHGSIRRHSTTHERRFLGGLRSLADYIQNEDPFDFIFSREGLRERSHPLMPQE
jgi:hypothetical protein